MDAELASKPIAAGGGAWAGSALRFSPAHTGLHYAAADAALRAGDPVVQQALDTQWRSGYIRGPPKMRCQSSEPPVQLGVR
jgi:hypothetical protein